MENTESDSSERKVGDYQEGYESGIEQERARCWAIVQSVVKQADGERWIAPYNSIVYTWAIAEILRRFVEKK